MSKARQGDRGEEEKKQVARTLENTREHASDLDVGPAAPDVWAERVLRGEVRPRLLLTTGRGPAGRRAYDFIADCLLMFPQSVFRERGKRSVEEVRDVARAGGFSDVWVVRTDVRGHFRYLVHMRAAEPAMYTYRLSSVVCAQEMHERGAPSAHDPEVLPSHFCTALGRHVGQCLAALFPHQGVPRGRQVVTIRNHRDYIFFRFHRYIFRQTERGGEVSLRTRLQELGPRFTLKLVAIDHVPLSDGKEQWWPVRALTRGKRWFAM